MKEKKNVEIKILKTELVLHRYLSLGKNAKIIKKRLHKV